MKSWMLHCLAAASICACVGVVYGWAPREMLKAIVPSKRSGVWGTSDVLERWVWTGREVMGVLLEVRTPEVGSWKRVRREIMEDLPAPEGPTMPMNSPGRMVRLRSRRLGVGWEG